ncbi:MAG: adenylate/guanylate cyclase domain-containing protein [Alphaproteobacteria bacterium]|nr:adenylate/guanylate cyclase domain-containing protein [Alphaproteobacteria bacterium]
MAETEAALSGLERKLAVILAADVAEYSRLMAEDEERTLQTFRGHQGVFEKLVQLHRGRVFNTAGDAILAEFSSAVEAVRCATEIQAALRTRNDQLPSERQVNFRIGVNLGDVMVQGGDLLGDGVNVAARLQAVAEPGGICISGSVYDQVLNKLSLSFKPLGELNYKNLPQPVRTFAIAKVAGLGVLPSPARWHRSAIGPPLRPIVIATLVLTAAGGVSWVRYHHERNLAEHGSTAELPARLKALADQRWAEKDARRLAKTDRRMGDAEALAAPEAEQTDPLSGPTAPVTPAAATPGDDASGLYRGQICFGKGLPSRCFKAQGVIANNKISGQWPSVIPGSTVHLAGDVTHMGNVEIHMNSQRADGSRGAVADMVGKLHDGHIDATGSFLDGRSVTLNWSKN